ncbi:MAG: hypothetical protein ABEJ95_02810 [Candidatus Nanohalobium sp.]
MSQALPYSSLEELGEELEDRSLLDYMAEHTDGDVSVPYKGESLDEEAYVQAVMDIHFDETYGTPFWRERMDDLGFDPREEVESIEDLRMLGEADEEALRERPVEDFMPRLFARQERGSWESYDEVKPDPAGYDMSKSSGSTGKKKIMPWRVHTSDEMIEWYNHNFEIRGLEGGNWLIAGPPGLYEEHTTEAAARTGGVPIYNGFQTRSLKPQMKDLGQAFGQPVEFLKEAVADPGKVPSALEGMVRSRYIEKALEEDLQSERVEVIASVPKIVERMHGMMDSEETVTDPEDIQAILASGMSVDQEFLENAGEMYPNAEVIPMYATSFTGANFDDPESDEAEYHSLYPLVDFNVLERTGEPLEEREEVDYGERGQVVFNHLSSGFLWPNQAERETAVRNEPSESFESNGDGISSLRPLDI